MNTQIRFAHFTLCILVIASCIALAASVHAASTGISAALQPQRISQDEAAKLTVTIQGSQMMEPQLPQVDGLRFIPVGQSSSFQSINGAVSASVSYLYQVSATKPGSYAIPAIRAGNSSSKPMQLEVLKGSGLNNGTQSLGRALPPPNVNWPSTSQSSESANDQPAFLRVVTPRQELFVGELIPIQIKAYFRQGMSASLNGLPTLNSDAFTLSKLTAQPEQSQEIVDGMPYTVVTWPSTLAPVKAGDFVLDLELPVMVRVQQRSASRMRNPFDAAFDESFFNEFFGRVNEKPVTLKTDLAAMKVLPLPANGRPADFSGAVGQFEVRSEAAPASATVGEPLSLKLTVSGTGNFDRVTSSVLSAADGFRTYKPSASFEPADSAGLQGSKTFEQAVVPQQSGQVEIPAIAFSYFDPEARQYVTRETQPIPVTVAGSIGKNAHTATVSPQSATVVPTTAATATDNGLQPNAVEPGRFVSSLQPVLLRPWFAVIVAAPVVLLACGLLYLKRRQRISSSPDHALDVASAAALRENLAQMDSAASADAERTFFMSARLALQERLAQVWNVPPSAVTLAEINSRLKDAGADIRAIFQAADQIAYAGQLSMTGDLQHWRQIVHEQIKRMEQP